MEDKDKNHDEKCRSAALPAVIAALCVCAAVALIAVFAHGPGIGQVGSGAPAQETQRADGADSGNADDAAGSQQAEAHVHDWTITYKTVHHDAVTHTETVAPVYGSKTTYHTVCNECQQVIDGKADEHIRETGHSGYSTNVPITDEVVVTEGYTHEVTDTPAYDETVPDKMVCTTCGATQEVPAAATS